MQLNSQLCLHMHTKNVTIKSRPSRKRRFTTRATVIALSTPWKCYYEVNRVQFVSIVFTYRLTNACPPTCCPPINCNCILFLSQYPCNNCRSRFTHVSQSVRDVYDRLPLRGSTRNSDTRYRRPPWPMWEMHYTSAFVQLSAATSFNANWWKFTSNGSFRQKKSKVSPPQYLSLYAGKSDG